MPRTRRAIRKQRKTRKQKGGNVNEFVRAAKSGYLEPVAALLLQNPGILNEQDENGRSALMSAAEKNRIRIVEYLIRHGANVNVQNPNGKTALVYAVNEKNADIVQLLLENNANPNLTYGRDNDHVLPLAVSRKCVKCVRYLLASGRVDNFVILYANAMIDDNNSDRLNRIKEMLEDYIEEHGLVENDSENEMEAAIERSIQQPQPQRRPNRVLFNEDPQNNEDPHELSANSGSEINSNDPSLVGGGKLHKKKTPSKDRYRK
jgi:ankyrin repeat protein